MCCLSDRCWDKVDEERIYRKDGLGKSCWPPLHFKAYFRQVPLEIPYLHHVVF